MDGLTKHGNARALFEPQEDNSFSSLLTSISDHSIDGFKTIQHASSDYYFKSLRYLTGASSSSVRARVCQAEDLTTKTVGKIRILCISDTHNAILDIDCSKYDLLIHSGDLTEAGTDLELATTLNWLEGLSIPHKVFIGGNHDFSLEKLSTHDITERYPSLTYLNHSSARLEINGHQLTIFGTPKTPRYGGFTAFSYRHDEDPFMDTQVSCDIFVSHGPVAGYVDEIGHKHAGCAKLLKLIRTVKPDLFVCGHIHVAGGSQDTVILDDLEEYRLERAWVSALAWLWLSGKRHALSLRSTLFVNAAVADSSRAPLGLNIVYG